MTRRSASACGARGISPASGPGNGSAHAARAPTPGAAASRCGPRPHRAAVTKRPGTSRSAALLHVRLVARAVLLVARVEPPQPPAVLHLFHAPAPEALPPQAHPPPLGPPVLPTHP